MNKNLITISLAVFIVAVIGILGASAFSNQGKTSNNAVSSTGSGISVTDVAKHNTSSDCWMIINNKVYNATSIIPSHPGGPNVIAAFCGKDATTAFDTRSGKDPHPQRAQDNLNNFYVGDLAR